MSGTIVAQTPFWVWLILFYLLRVGYQCLRDHTVNRYKAVLLAVIFFLLSLKGLYNAPHSLFVWLTGLVVGLGLGYVLFHAQIEHAYRNIQQQLVLPGHANVLVLLICIFALHYLFAVMAHIRPNDIWSSASVMLSSLTNGAFCYRALKIVRKGNIDRLLFNH